MMTIDDNQSELTLMMTTNFLFWLKEEHFFIYLPWKQTFIKILQPELCRQKEFVYTLKLRQ